MQRRKLERKIAEIEKQQAAVLNPVNPVESASAEEFKKLNGEVQSLKKRLDDLFILVNGLMKDVKTLKGKKIEKEKDKDKGEL